ncbi:MAG TPA: serine/threonine-protein kinase [Vicinamibacterales bacterium]
MERFDDYLNPELLGGGMSRVYRAVRRDGRVVAVKSVALGNEDVARAERRGAQLQQQFHAVEPRVPDVYGIRTQGPQLLIEMEYIEGEDLSTRIRSRGRLEPAEAVRIAMGLADVLDRAHRFTAVVDGETYHGIVHGDLKPRNVRLIASDEPLDARIRVLDFGVAKGIRGAEGETRNVFGSAPYMSPERLVDGNVSAPSDCWSLGVVLCEMLTGRVPFQGSEREVLHQIEEGPPVLPPDCPSDLQALVERILARDIRSRLTSAGAIRDELTRWLEATRRTTPVAASTWVPPVPPTFTVPPLPGSTVADPGETRRTVPQPAEAAPPPSRRRRKWRRIAALAALAWIVFNVGREIRVWRESGLLGRRVYAAEPAALDQMLATYSTLSQRSAFGVGTWPAREPLRTALVQHVDRVILDFRRPQPTVRETQWKQARAWAAAALEMGGDSSVRSRFLVCDAHLKRISGDAALRRGQADRGRRLINEAISGFEEAARLVRTSPDPWLGLFRLHALTRKDPEQAQEALNEAARRGYETGPRDYFILGESARLKAESLERECEALRETQTERGCLQQARAHHEKALEWYEKAIGYYTAARSAAGEHQAIQRIDDRLTAIEEASASNLGLDLLRAAMRAVEAHTRKP